jgi:outer membrane immunogenic protein
LLFGLETDYGFFDIGQSKTLSFTSGLLINPPITETLSQKISTDWLWTLRPRIGYVSGPWMVYLTGGLAVSKIKYRVSFSDTRIPPDSVSQSFGDTKTGWTAGVGGAMALNPQWSVKAEYLYTDLGNIRGSLATPTGFVNLTSQVDITANIFRAGVDFRF